MIEPTSTDARPSTFPVAQLQEASESHRTSLLTADELREYCQNLFQFKETRYKKFRFKYSKECFNFWLPKLILCKAEVLLTIFKVELPFWNNALWLVNTHHEICKIKLNFFNLCKSNYSTLKFGFWRSKFRLHDECPKGFKWICCITSMTCGFLLVNWILTF